MLLRVGNPYDDLLALGKRALQQCCAVVVARAEPHGNRPAGASAYDGERRRLPRMEPRGDDPDDVVGALDRDAVDRDDHVTAALDLLALECLDGRAAVQARLRTRAAGRDVVDQGAVEHGNVNVAGESRVKIFLHSRRLPGRQGVSASLRRNERINPGIVEWIKLQRVFGRIEVCPEIVSSQFRNARNHPRPGTAGRADHNWSQIDHADTCHGRGW